MNLFCGSNLNKMEALVLKINNQGELIRNFMVNTNKTGRNNQTKGFIAGRLELLKGYWNKYEVLNEKILNSQNLPDSNKSQVFLEENIFVEIEQLYGEHLGALNDRLYEESSDKILHSSTPINTRTKEPTLDIKLPHIRNPTFSGDYTAWTSFHDLFEALVVKKSSLTDVQRLHHLKSFLSGDAEVLLRKYSVQENNFEPAWAL